MSFLVLKWFHNVVFRAEIAVNDYRAIIDKRFNVQYNESHAEKYGTSKDRVLEELFLYEIGVKLQNLPLERIRKQWYKTHRSGYLKGQKKSKTLMRLMDEENKYDFV